VGAAALVMLLMMTMMLGCVVAGGELWVREMLKSAQEAQSCQYHDYFFRDVQP